MRGIEHQWCFPFHHYPMQVRIDPENQPAITVRTKAENRSAAFIVNEVLKRARKAGLLIDPPKDQKAKR